MPMKIRERLAFLAQFRADFHHTGAIQPSSRYLAQAMTEPLRLAPTWPGRQGLRVLEIGPGTGAVTRSIVGSMRGKDRLECYEVNPAFVRFLERLICRDPHFHRVAGQIHLFNAPAQELETAERFDFIVCSAPLNNFDAAAIEAIFDTGFAALEPNGCFTFFEYLALPVLRRWLVRGPEGQALAATKAAKDERLSRHSSRSRRVWLNLPPAVVHHLRANGG
ncbi:MAG: class I SAM-dependent methyltransferase [Acidobacteriota bacterium]